MSAIAPSANRRRATRSEVLPDWIPAVRPRRSATDEAFGVRCRLTAMPWVEFKVRLRKQNDSGTFRGNRRSRYHCIAGALRKTLEDSVEVVARVRHRLQAHSQL